MASYFPLSVASCSDADGPIDDLCLVYATVVVIIGFLLLQESDFSSMLVYRELCCLCNPGLATGNPVNRVSFDPVAYCVIRRNHPHYKILPRIWLSKSFSTLFQSLVA